MSSLPRRMQRIVKRGKAAKKSAISRNFATKLGVPTRPAKRNYLPLVLRRSKNSIKWLEARAESRRAAK